MLKKVCDRIAACVAVVASMISGPSFAEPTGTPANVTLVRVYDNGQYSFALLYINNPDLCGTGTFTIPLDTPAGPGMLSIAMTAMTTQKLVKVEVSNVTGCQGQGSRLQSIYLLP